MFEGIIGVDLKHEVHLKLKPERKPRTHHKIPKDICRPSARSMEPVYTDGEYFYRVAPLEFPESEHIGRMMACMSYLYYGIGKYEKDTGRFLGAEYSHTDRAEVEKKLNCLVENLSWEKIDYPYILYDLRISNGYLY